MTVTPPAPPTNAAPTLAAPSGETVVQENVTGTVLTVEASDPDGDTLTYALVSGDTAPLQIDSVGAISFVERPDFEDPADSDTDNVYTVGVRVSDPQGATAETDVTIRVTDEPTPEQGLYTERQFSDIRVTRNIQFQSDRGLFADLFEAADSFGERRERPLIILASGGGFIAQSRASVEPIARDFAARGWLAVTIDYRTLGRFPRDEAEIQVAATRAVHDMFAAVRSARAGDGIVQTDFDSTRIVVGGESAGGVMAVTAAALDPDDPISAPAIRDYLADNGGVYGDLLPSFAERSDVQGALVLSGAVFDLDIIDAETAPTFAAHEEDDTVVPCEEGPEGATGTNGIVIGACDFVPDMIAKGVRAESYIVEDDAGHVDFTDEERAEIYDAAAALLVEALFRAD